MRKLLILFSLFLGGCLSIVNNNGQTPQETSTMLGGVRQLPAEQTMPQVVMLPNGQYALLTAQATPTPQSPMQVNIEGNILLPSPTPDLSDIARDLPNPPVSRELVVDCLPCECAPCETPTPTPQPTVKPCTALDVEKLTAILNKGGLEGQYTFCRSLSDSLMIDVAFGDRLALLNSGKKKEFTVLTRQGKPVLTINNQVIRNEYEGKTNAIVEWLHCQLDDALPVLSAE